MAKEQRLIFTIGKTSDGMMKINMSFYPPLSKNAEAFEKLPMQQREMQSAAASLGKFAMQRMALMDQQKTTQPELISIDEAAFFDNVPRETIEEKTDVPV